MWAAKLNHLDELDAVVVSDLPSEILFKKSIFGLFSKCPVNHSCKNSCVLHGPSGGVMNMELERMP
jgi:hypothetical protein